MKKIAVLGHGVVGSGTVELFLKNKDMINRRCGTELELGKVLDIRDFPGLPYSDKFTKNIDDIISDPEIAVVAEVMGGVDPAFDFVSRCLKAGKSVCTSNKELVAKKGAELLRLARENGCNFMFEASTGGAIPIIRPLHTCLAANEITGAAGILNGTTNFILTKMLTDNMTLDDALAMAQRLGYAERDPAADIEGHDACRKICILSSLIFGRHVYPENVYVEGITNITLEDAEYAAAFGGAVKLIGSVKRLDSGKILPMVAPAFVCGANPLSHVDDVFNGIMVFGDGFGETMFYGRGAGKLPTASAVLGDVIDCARRDGTDTSLGWEDGDGSFIADRLDNETRMYLRVKGSSREKVNAAFPGCEYLTVAGHNDEFAVITPTLSEREIEEKITGLGVDILGKIRILDM